MSRILIAVLSIAASTACAGEELVCPRPISVTESLNAEPPAGWTVRAIGTPRYLAGVSFYDGDPSQDFDLAPDSDEPAGKERIATWIFGKRVEPIWLVCRYLGTGIMLQKPLSLAFGKCQVRYEETGMVTSVSGK